MSSIYISMYIILIYLVTSILFWRKQWPWNCSMWLILITYRVYIFVGYASSFSLYICFLLSYCPTVAILPLKISKYIYLKHHSQYNVSQMLSHFTVVRVPKELQKCIGVSASTISAVPPVYALCYLIHVDNTSEIIIFGDISDILCADKKGCSRSLTMHVSS